MRIVVSGATGNTGSSVVKHLSASGHNVVALTRDPSSKSSKELASLPGVEVVRNENAFDKPADRAYLCAFNGADQFITETAFIVAARKAGVKYIVKLSTMDAYMDIYSEVYYARAHLAVEFFLEKGDIPFTCLRANIFTGFLGVDLGAAKTTGHFKILVPGANVAAVDAGDVGKVAASLLALEDPSPYYGKKLVINGPEDINDAKIAQVLTEEFGKEVVCDGAPSQEMVDAFLHQAGYSLSLKDSFVKGMGYFFAGKASLAYSKTSPEVLALAPPTTTFRDLVKRFAK